MTSHPTPTPTPTPSSKLGRTPQELLRIQNLAALVESTKNLGPITERLVATGRGTLASLTGQDGDEDNLPLPPPPGGGGGRALSFAQTEAGVRLSASFALDEERQRGRAQLTLQDTLFGLARELLPAGDVDSAIRSIERGELINSKIQFQAALQALADRQSIALRQEELDIREEIENKTLRQARARIVVDMIGKDVSRAVLFALSSGSGS